MSTNIPVEPWHRHDRHCYWDHTRCGWVCPPAEVALPGVESSAVESSAVESSAVESSAVEFSAVEFSAVEFSAANLQDLRPEDPVRPRARAAVI